jgi:hypothetical protein
MMHSRGSINPVLPTELAQQPLTKTNGAYGHQKLRSFIAVTIMTVKRLIATEERDKGQGTAEEQECDAMYAHRMEDLLGACW